MKSLRSSLCGTLIVLATACSSPRKEAEGSRRTAEDSPGPIALWQAIQIAQPEAAGGVVVEAAMKGDACGILVLAGTQVKEIEIGAQSGKVTRVSTRPVRAGREEYAAKLRDLAPAAKVDLIDAIEIAQMKAGGTARAIQAQVEEDELRYAVVVVADGKTKEVAVDGASGAVLLVQVRDAGEEELAKREERAQAREREGMEERGEMREREETEEIEGEPARRKGGKTPATSTWSFDDLAAGALPGGWKVEGTKQEGPLATWRVIADDTAPSKPNVLALTSANHESGSTFNLCWTDRVRFQHGSIEVSFKPVSGEGDQGGGVMWRAKDKDNYYFCRVNPLESNFRVYVVQDGVRKQLGTVKATIEAGTWHTIQVGHEGPNIACSLDGTRLLRVTDSTLPDAGGVGLWTKADAVTSFDDLEVRALPITGD